MDKSHLDRFFEDMRISVDEAVGKMLATVDVEKSNCIKVEDKERIFETVRLTVGFKANNSMVFERLRELMVEVTEQAVSDNTVTEAPCTFLFSFCAPVDTAPVDKEDVIKLIDLRMTLAALYKSQGDYTRARLLYEDCFRKREEVLGDKHPDTLASLNNLALLCQSQCDYTRAQSLYEDCLRKRKEVLGDKHSDTLASQNNLAGLYQSQGDFTRV